MIRIRPTISTTQSTVLLTSVLLVKVGMHVETSLRNDCSMSAEIAMPRSSAMDVMRRPSSRSVCTCLCVCVCVCLCVCECEFLSMHAWEVVVCVCVCA